MKRTLPVDITFLEELLQMARGEKTIPVGMCASAVINDEHGNYIKEIPLSISKNQWDQMVFEWEVPVVHLPRPRKR